MTYGIQPSLNYSYGNAGLSTLGMKIRQAVANGHSLHGDHTYNAQFFSDYPSLDQPQGSSEEDDYNQLFEEQDFHRPQRLVPQRLALPPNMDMPPALTRDGSTFQSGLNVSEWGAPSMVSTNLPEKRSLKRKMSGSDNVQIQGESPEDSHAYFPSYDQFTAQNGQLSFNEDF